MANRTLVLLIAMFTFLVASAHLKYKSAPDFLSMMETAEFIKEPTKWIGKTAPNIELELLDGSKFKLEDAVGQKLLIINFFATWCGPCRKEMPELEKYFKNHSDKVLLLAVDQKEDKDKVKSFVDKMGLSFPVALDKNGAAGGLYGVKSLPVTVVVDVSGHIMDRRDGAVSNAEVTFGQYLMQNEMMISAGLSVNREKYLEAIAHEDYQGLGKKRKSLGSRGDAITAKMSCPCGCKDKVNDCSCDTAKKINKDLKEGFASKTYENMTDAQIITSLNEKYCVK
ncbi:MAG: TlpA family protein disulfide reductase [Nitrospinota bacterium]|nr:TlpA family protein disulfide reductase [Nitrospinota bacterium]